MSSKTAKPARASCKKPAPGSCTNCHASWKRGRAACKTGPGFMQHGSGLHAKSVQASCKTDPGVHAKPRIHAHPGPAACKTCPGAMENRPRLHAQPVLASYNTGHGQLWTRPASCTTGFGFIQHRARPTREANRSVVSPGHSTSRVYRVLHSVARVIKVASGFLISPPAYSKYPPA